MIRRPASRVATLNEREILSDERFLQELRNLASSQQLTEQAAVEQAEAILEELAVRPEDRYLNWVAKLAGFMYSRSYDKDLDVNTDQLDRLRGLAREHPLVFLWSHKSHLDSFVFMRAMYDNNFIPQPLSFAGINMNFAGFGALAKRSGAIFVRRSFTDDEIYKLVFTHYIDYLVAKRLPLSWSIEGTRSRTGKLMPPKLGLINWVLDAHRRTGSDKVLLVPVSISFDQIAEMDDYVAMQRGLPKRKESLKWFIDYIRGMKNSFGKIYVRFAEPVALSDKVDISQSMFSESSAPDRIQTQKMAFEVCNRIERATPVTISDVITLVLLSANGRALDKTEIRNHVLEIAHLVEHKNIPTAGSFEVDDHRNISTALDLLTNSRLLVSSMKAGEEVFSIRSGQHLAAAYYRNTIIHYFLGAAVAEIAMAALSTGRVENPQDELMEKAMSLRDLLKFEFFFKRRDEFQKGILDYLEDRYPDWQATLIGKRPPFENNPPLFGQGILRSFIEAYFVLSRALKSGKEPTGLEQNELAAVCLAIGEKMLSCKKIDCESALSKPLFENAVRLAVYRDLLSADSKDIVTRRNQFSLEMDQFLAAINQLQMDYDQHLLETPCAN